MVLTRRICRVPQIQRGGQRFLALDCEMVEGEGRRTLLAEVGIVDWDGNTVYHAYVQPGQHVVDYRTAISGITPEMLTSAAGARSFGRVRREVLDILRGNILIGHALENDLKALRISREELSEIRNTAHHNFFKTMNAYGRLHPQKLAALYSRYVGNAEIQQGAHSAIEDARAAMWVYRTYHSDWLMPVVHSGPVLERGQRLHAVGKSKTRRRK